MAQLFVPVPYATIADALAAANPSDEIVLAAGYSGETVAVTINGLTITGDASNTGIVLQVGGTANQLTLGGTLGASVIGEAAKSELLIGNAGNNTFTLVGGSSAANTAPDTVDFGSGSSDRLILDYSATTAGVTGLVNGLGSDGINYQVYMGGQLRVEASNVDIFEITGGSGSDSFTSFSGADILNGGGGNDQLNAQTGDDILNGGSGNDTLTGGGGNDTAVFSGNRSAYTFTQTGAATGTIVGTDGTDSVNGVEFFQFADGTFTFAQLLPNTAPTLTGFGPSITFGETLVNGTPQILDGDVNFNDAQGNFDGGVLALSGLLAEDRASIRNQGSAAGQIGYNAGTGAVSYGGVQIGTATGGVGNTLIVTLNAAATSIAVDALIENLTYANVSNTPTLNRTFNLSVTDFAGLTFGTAVDQLTEQTGAGNPFAGVDVGGLANPALFDYDGDGDLDVVLGGAANPASASLRLFRNDNGATTFTEITGAANPFTVVGATPNFIAPGFGDIDGDGDKDLVLGVDVGGAGTVRTFRNDSGVFTELTGGANPFGATFGDSYPIPSFVDIDGDGDDDAVFGKGDGTLAVYRNENASLAFTLLTGGANPFNGLDFGTYTAPSFVDLDGDRDLDLVVGKGSAGLRSFRNDGAGVFTELVGAANPAQEVSSTDSVPIFGDLDGDGDPDLLVGQTDGTLRVYGNTLADTRFIAVTVNPENEAPTPQDDVLDGTEGADTIDALAGNDTVNGLGGNDLLIGNDGDDILNGGEGDDVLRGGVGADTLNGGNGTDTADYSASTAAVQVELGSAFANGGDSTGDTFSSVENVTGSAFADFLTGDAAANVLRGGDSGDILAGGGGNDTLIGGAGNDIYNLGTGDAGDTIVEDADEGSDTVNSALASYTLSDNVERGVGVLTGVQTINGNALDNYLEGFNSTAFTADGGDGNDTLIGGRFFGPTNDVLNGGSGNDTLLGAAGDDMLDGGADFDIAQFSGNRSAYTITRTSPTSLTITGPDGTDTVSNVENFQFADGGYSFEELTNTAPTLTGFGPSVTFLENTVNATPQLLDADVTFNDAEDNFVGGAVVLSGLLAEDRVSIQNQGAAPGQIGFDGTTVTYGSVAIGTASGGVGGTFTVTLNAAANSVAVDALIQSLTYANVSDTPTATRSLTLEVTDASGARISAPGPSNFTEDTSAGRPFAGVDVGQFSAPTFIDLDGDGDQDAVVGELNGTLLIFTNTAAAGQPASFTQNTDAGRPFPGVTFNFLPAPSFVDLDGDGDLDAVVGDNTGTLKVFTNVAAAGQPASFIQNNDAGRPFAGIDIGSNSAPSFVDLDGDGDQDAVIGEEFGTLRIFVNTAAAGQPASFTENTAADRPFAGVDVSNLARPSFVDLDGDGDLDAVIGNTEGTLRIFTNTAAAGQPATFVEDTSAGRPFAGVDVDLHSAPSFVDLDGDGDLDAVVGANDGTLRVFINSSTPVSPTITVNVTAESDLDFVGTAADDVFIVNADGTYTRNGVGPGPLPSDLTLNAGAGDDLLVINNPAGSVQNRTFNYNGQTNSADGTGDRLEIRGGTFTSAVYNYTNATDGSVVLTNGADVLTVNYTGLEPVLVDADAAPLTSTFNLGGFDTTFALLDNGNTPNDGQLLLDALDGTFEDTEFTEPTGLLTINGEGGNLAVNGVSQRNGDLTITSGGFLQTNGLLTLTGDLRLQAGGETDLNVNAGITNNSTDADAETITLTGQRSVGVNSVIQVANPATGGALNVNVASDSDGVGGGQVFINSTGAIRSNGGSINLSGGVDPATGRATGAFASQKGVVVLGELTSGAGAITVRGQGAGTGTDARGVQIEGAAAVVSSTSGLITIDGLGGPGGEFSRGVSVFSGARVSTVDGGVSLTGLATASTGAQSSGIGIGNANTVIETTGSGAISITGVGASATGNINSGIGMFGGAQIRSNAAGATGSITLTGTGRGTGAQETGVQLDGGTLISSRVGDISITGRSDGTGTGAFHIGVLMFSGTNAIESTESADITINGTGGVSGSSGEGVYIFGATTQVRSLGSGDISITGEARIAASNAVIIQSGTLVGGATMTGDILLRSLGGAGVLLDNALIRTGASAGADVTLNLSAAGTAQQINGGSIIADGLRLLSSAASTFALTAAANDVNTIAGAITGSASFTDVDDLVVGTVTTASTAGAAATTTTGLSTTGALALTAGVLAVNANVSGSGVSLAARDSVTGSLSFASGVTIDGGAGGITLSAADDLTLAGATLTTTGALVINLDVGDADAEGATFSLGGDFTAASVTLNGGSESDSFTLTADVTGTLNGGAGDDVLTSGAGDQTLNGGSGVDIMTGGTGNDTYVVDDLADSVTELADGGDSDTVTTSLSTFILGVTAGSANVENLQGSGSADQILIGTAGANQISGADGNDTLVGGAGADALSGGGGVDYADYGISGAGVTIDLTAGTGLGGDAEGDTLTGIENVTGSYLNDTLLGDGAANALFGSVGDDVLNGGAGDDFLDGGLGIDSLTGGDGNDSIRFDADDTFVSGGAGFDIGYVTGGTRTVINLETASLEYVQDLAGGDDWFQGTFRTDAVTVFAGAGTDVVQGGAGNDVLWGEAGNDTIVGGAGADVLVGGSGADLMNGGAGRDILYGGVADGAQDLFRFTTGGAANWDFVREFEVGTDKIDLRAIATSFANVAVTVVGGNTNVSISGQLVCVVIGVTNLTDNDFLLGAPGSSMADLFKDDLPFVQPADAEVALIPSHDFDVGMFDFADRSGHRGPSHALTSDYDWIV